MSSTIIGIITVSVTILFGILAWLVSGLIGWGRAAEQLANHTLLISQIQQTMLKPQDLKTAVLEIQLQLIDKLDAKFYTKEEGRRLERRMGERRGEEHREDH